MPVHTSYIHIYIYPLCLRTIHSWTRSFLKLRNMGCVFGFGGCNGMIYQKQDPKQDPNKIESHLKFTAWWFQTFSIFTYMWNNHPN